MLSPEVYYEQRIKGKKADEVDLEIEYLRRQIAHMKRNIEEQYISSYKSYATISTVQLRFHTIYLKIAIREFVELGGVYVPNLAEKKNILFDKDIKNIKMLSLLIQKNSMVIESRSITLDPLHVRLSIETKLDNECINMVRLIDTPFSKESFIEELCYLQIGNWKKKYVNNSGINGIEWEFEIVYGNNVKTKKYMGSDAYPFSFDVLCRLFGIEGLE